MKQKRQILYANEQLYFKTADIPVDTNNQRQLNLGQVIQRHRLE